MKIKVTFGLANETSKDFPAGTTVGQLRNDPNLKAWLGFGENVNFVIDGVPQPDSATLGEGDEVLVETKANTKG